MLSLKPWVKVNGEINRPVLDRLLGAVLSHIMTRPGCTILQLTQQFQPAYQPFQIRELVEVRFVVSNRIKLSFLKQFFLPSDFGKNRMCKTVLSEEVWKAWFIRPSNYSRNGYDLLYDTRFK